MLSILLGITIMSHFSVTAVPTDDDGEWEVFEVDEGETAPSDEEWVDATDEDMDAKNVATTSHDKSDSTASSTDMTSTSDMSTTDSESSDTTSADMGDWEFFEVSHDTATPPDQDWIEVPEEEAMKLPPSAIMPLSTEPTSEETESDSGTQTSPGHDATEDNSEGDPEEEADESSDQESEESQET